MSGDMSAQEVVVIETLRRSGPCCLDDLVRYLPNLSWDQVFVTVNRMSSDGRVWVFLRPPDYTAYQIALPSQLAPPLSPSRQKEPQPRLLSPRELHRVGPGGTYGRFL
jgi:hypothetical protein